MKFKKALSVVIVGAALSVTATSVFAGPEPTAVSGVGTPSAPSVTAVSDSVKRTAEPLAQPTVVKPGDIDLMRNNLVIDDKGISNSSGKYENTWTQPKDWGYYRFYVQNTTDTSVTIHIQENGGTQTYSLDANKGQAWTQYAANEGEHRIVVTTSDGRTFTGDVSVRIADAPFN